MNVYPINMRNLERYELLRKVIHHVAQIRHVVAFDSPKPTNLIHEDCVWHVNIIHITLQLGGIEAITMRHRSKGSLYSIITRWQMAVVLRKQVELGRLSVTCFSIL